MKIVAALLALTLLAAAPAPDRTPVTRASPGKASSHTAPDRKAPDKKASDKTAPDDKATPAHKHVPARADGSASPAQKPVWEVTTVAADAVDVPRSIYVIRPGDTLSAVVRKTGAGADVIAHDNDLKAPFTLQPSQNLKISAGRYHTVKKGQSGIAIARAYGVEWSRIVDLNHLEEPFTLREGQRLMLPAAREVAKMSLEQRAAAFTLNLSDIATGGEPALAPKAKAVAPTASPARTLAATTPVAEPVADFGGRFAWPVQGRIIRPYGPMANGGRNDGINIAAPFGTLISSAGDGVVMWVGQHPAFGNVVLVRHGGGWVTIYGNADKLLVKRGQSVKIGQSIARVGMSGSSADQPQLFFEVLQGRKPVSPTSLLPKQSGGDGGDARPDTNSN